VATGKAQKVKRRYGNMAFFPGSCPSDGRGVYLN
jgi:hypothetical protein